MGSRGLNVITDETMASVFPHGDIKIEFTVEVKLAVI
jgi:hypothetical protein